MKNSRNELLKEAILSRDKLKLKKALQKAKPEKWIVIKFDCNEGTIKYNDEFVSKEQMKAIIKEEEEAYEVKIITTRFASDNGEMCNELMDFIMHDDSKEVTGIDII